MLCALKSHTYLKKILVLLKGVPCKSNKPSNTVFRAPGTCQGSHFIENILDRIAAHLNKDPADVCTHF